MPHSVSVIVTGKAGVPLIEGHCGYVAGQYRDGFLSDAWTDVTRCAVGTFVGYAPACTCGWVADDVQPGTPAGLQACQRLLVADHLSGLCRVRPPAPATVSTMPGHSVAPRQVVCVAAMFQSASA